MSQFNKTSKMSQCNCNKCKNFYGYPSCPFSSKIGRKGTLSLSFEVTVKPFNPLIPAKQVDTYKRYGVRQGGHEGHRVIAAVHRVGLKCFDYF